MRVLVATDLSAAADLALQQAAESTLGSSDELAVVHVMPRHASLGVSFPRQQASELAPSEIAARANAAAREHIDSKVRPGVDKFIREGVDYAEIVRCAEAWGADRIVVGSHGRTGLARLFGTVSDRVIRWAHCDVLVVRQSPPTGPVLAATDLSPAARPSLVAGAREAQRRGAPLLVVHAIDFLEVEATYLLEASTGIGSPNVFELARQGLADAVAKLGVPADCRILACPAATAILQEAEALGAQLVVVGARGHTGLARLALGGVAQRVAQGAPCSVLVAREPAASG
ncbi:MAG: universal stress protein [Polyangiaceae bacterium]|jgi:nucleotide-binding universal stress UspA family protein